MDMLNGLLGFDVANVGREFNDTLNYLVDIVGYVFLTFMDNAWPVVQMLVGTLILAWTTLCVASVWVWQMCGGAGTWARQLLGVVGTEGWQMLGTAGTWAYQILVGPFFWAWQMQELACIWVCQKLNSAYIHFASPFCRNIIMQLATLVRIVAFWSADCITIGITSNTGADVDIAHNIFVANGTIQEMLAICCGLVPVFAAIIHVVAMWDSPTYVFYSSMLLACIFVLTAKIILTNIVRTKGNGNAVAPGNGNANDSDDDAENSHDRRRISRSKSEGAGPRGASAGKRRGARRRTPTPTKKV